MSSDNLKRFIIKKNIEESEELWNIILDHIDPDEILKYKKVWATNIQVFKLLKMNTYKAIWEHIKNHEYINSTNDEEEILQRMNKVIQWSISYIVTKFATEIERNLFLSKIRSRYKTQWLQKKVITQGQYERTKNRISKLRHLCKIHRSESWYVDRKKVIDEYIASWRINGYTNARKIIDYNICWSRVEVWKSPWNDINEAELQKLIIDWKNMHSKYWKYHWEKWVLNHEKIILSLVNKFPKLDKLTRQVWKLKIQRELNKINYPNWDKPKRINIWKWSKEIFQRIISEWLKEWSKYWKYNGWKRTLNYDIIIKDIKNEVPSLAKINDKKLRSSKIQYVNKTIRKMKDK